MSVCEEKKQEYKKEGFTKVGERPGWFHLFCDLVLNLDDTAL